MSSARTTTSSSPPPPYRWFNSVDTWSCGSSAEKKKSLSTFGERSTQTLTAPSPIAATTRETQWAFG